MPIKRNTTKPAIIKRRDPRSVGIFINGVGLDRACRRYKKRISWEKLLKHLLASNQLGIARYYNLLPKFDDSRQIAFADNLYKLGIDYVLKRLPPKGVEIQVGIEPEMATDILAYSLNRNDFPEIQSPVLVSSSVQRDIKDLLPNKTIILVCPNKELEYTVEFIKPLGVKTVTADFGSFSPKKVLTASQHWLELEETSNIWLD